MCVGRRRDGLQQGTVADGGGCDLFFLSFSSFLPHTHWHSKVWRCVCECGLAPRFPLFFTAWEVSFPSLLRDLFFQLIHTLSLSLSLSLPAPRSDFSSSPLVFFRMSNGPLGSHRNTGGRSSFGQGGGQQTESPTNAFLVARLSRRVNPHGGGLSVRTYALYSSSLSCPTEAHLQRKSGERESYIGTV